MTFESFYEESMKNNKSKINLFFNNSPERYDAIVDPEFTKDNFLKHSGSGLVLNRQHTEILVSENRISKRVGRMCLSPMNIISVIF